MSEQFSISLPNKIESITIMNECAESIGSDLEDICSEQSIEVFSKEQAKSFSLACQALNCAIKKIENHYNNFLEKQSEEITRISIEIARKILKHKIETNDYEMISIVKEILSNSPIRQDVIIELNPDDYEELQKSLKKENNNLLSDIVFVSNPKINRAECILKSPKGTICSRINDHLEQISMALGKVK